MHPYPHLQSFHIYTNSPKTIHICIDGLPEFLREFCSPRRPRVISSSSPPLLPLQIRAPAPPGIVNEALQGRRCRSVEQRELWPRRRSRGQGSWGGRPYGGSGGGRAYVPPARGRVTGCAVRTGPFLVRALNALFITPRLPLDPLLLRLLAAYLERQEGWELAFDPVFRLPQSLEG